MHFHHALDQVKIDSDKNLQKEKILIILWTYISQMTD